MKDTKQFRQSNIELLRIVSMFMIVVHHYATHGIRQSFNPDMGEIWLEGDALHRITTSFCMPGGTIGVGIFFLLTGYFMYGKKYKLQRLFKLLLQVYFYSFTVCIICISLKYFHIYDFPELKYTTIDFVKNALFPITSKSSGWFTQTYFVLFLLIPVINSFVERINTRYFVYLLFFVWFIWYAGTALIQSNYSDLQRGVFFYLLGVYLKRTNFKMNNTVAFISFILMWVAFAFIDYLTVNNSKGIFEVLMRQVRHLVCIPIAVVALFYFFKNLNIKNSKFINTVASTTFGIYLLHDCACGKPLVWNCIFHTLDIQYQSEWFIWYLIGTCITVFCVLSTIDYLRIRFIEKRYMPYCDNVLHKIIAKIKSNNSNAN